MTAADRLAEIRAREERAHDEVVRICRPGQDWRMTTPADRERDGDLIITKSLQDVPRLVAFAEAVLELADDLKGRWRYCRPDDHGDGEGQAFEEAAAEIRGILDEHLGGDR